MLQIQRTSDANLSKAIAEISVGQCSEETLQFLSSRNKPLSVPEGKQNIPLPPVARCIRYNTWISANQENVEQILE